MGASSFQERKEKTRTQKAERAKAHKHEREKEKGKGDKAKKGQDMVIEGRKGMLSCSRTHFRASL